MNTRFNQVFRVAALFTCIVMIHPMCFGEIIDTAIKRELELIRTYNLGQTDVIGSPKDMAHTMQATTAELIKDVYKTEVGDGSTPSPERQAVIDRFAALITPYNADLIKVGFSRDRALMDLAHQCRSLLEHTKPDKAFVTQLRSQRDDLTGNAGYAYDLLFQHRLLTGAEKGDLAKKVLAEPDQENRFRWAVKCSAMLIPEVVPVLQEMLSVPFTPDGTIGSTGVFGENEALSNYCKVMEAINYLGASAAPLLPLLKARLREIETALPPGEARIYAIKFQAAIAQVEGRAPLRIPTAINGSGPLASSSQSQNNPRHAAPPVPVMTSSTPIPSGMPTASPVK